MDKSDRAIEKYVAAANLDFVLAVPLIEYIASGRRNVTVCRKNKKR